MLAALKDSSKRQGDDNRRIEDDVRGLRDLIPKALDAQKEANDNRLKELSAELKSLKTLVGNRMSAAPPPAPRAPATPYYASQAAPANGTGSSTPAPQPASSEHTNGASSTEEAAPAPAMPGGASTGAANGSASAAAPAAEKPAQSWRGTQGRAAIPAWQMAAAKKTQDAKNDTSASGTVEASPSS